MLFRSGAAARRPVGEATVRTALRNLTLPRCRNDRTSTNLYVPANAFLRLTNATSVFFTGVSEYRCDELGAPWLVTLGDVCDLPRICIFPPSRACESKTARSRTRSTDSVHRAALRKIPRTSALCAVAGTNIAARCVEYTRAAQRARRRSRHGFDRRPAGCRFSTYPLESRRKICRAATPPMMQFHGGWGWGEKIPIPIPSARIHLEIIFFQHFMFVNINAIAAFLLYARNAI